jgi:hypothetical protein
LQLVPMKLIVRTAAVVMLGLAAYSLYSAVT